MKSTEDWWFDSIWAEVSVPVSDSIQLWCELARPKILAIDITFICLGGYAYGLIFLGILQV